MAGDPAADGSEIRLPRSPLFSSGIAFAAILFGLLRSPAAGWMRKQAHFGVWPVSPASAWLPRLGYRRSRPVVAGAAVFDRQLWWAATVAATAIGLVRRRAGSHSWLLKIAGIVCLALPHPVGAPVATGETIVPAELVPQFMVASLAAAAIFWLAVGMIGGFLDGRSRPSAAG